MELSLEQLQPAGVVRSSAKSRYNSESSESLLASWHAMLCTCTHVQKNSHSWNIVLLRKQKAGAWDVPHWSAQASWVIAGCAMLVHYWSSSTHTTRSQRQQKCRLWPNGSSFLSHGTICYALIPMCTCVLTQRLDHMLHCSKAVKVKAWAIHD